MSQWPQAYQLGLEQNLFPSLLAGDSQENLEEERRLFYVAITRAERRLFLSYTSSRFKWGNYIFCEPSQFLSEIDDRHIVKKEILSKKDKKSILNNLTTMIKSFSWFYSIWFYHFYSSTIFCYHHLKKVITNLVILFSTKDKYLLILKAFKA